MLDLIWILLFFFLMISTIRTDDAPESIVVETVPILQGQESLSTTQSAAHLTVTAEGTFNLGAEPVVREHLRARLTKLVQNPGSPDTLILSVDRQARVEDLLAAEDAARAVGLDCLVRRQADPEVGRAFPRQESKTAPARKLRKIPR
jgi:biopolymer transport protein ExbD